MRGAGAAAEGGIPEKWLRINQILREKRIAILAVQESHLTEERMKQINGLFEATMKIIGTADEENATGARGVAFAINKRILDPDQITMETVVEGRAAILEFRWSSERKLRLMNVYAPNNAGRNADFWRCLKGKVRRGELERPTVIAGDFNMVEHPMDRLPARKDTEEQMDELRSMMATMGMTDGIRKWNPKLRQFTYLQTATGSQSRIDRIYVANNTLKAADEWKIEPSGIRTDHSLVSMSIANYGTPHTGKGRWTIPGSVLGDRKFLDEVKKVGLAALNEIKHLGERSEIKNTQTIYAKLKRDLKDAARKRAKQCIPKLQREMDALKKDIKETVRREGEEEKDKALNTAILQDRLAKLEERRFGHARRAVAANDWVKGETICKYWTRLNSPKLPSTTINELECGTDERGAKRYTAKTERMASTAKDFYDGLQKDCELSEIDHEKEIRVCLAALEAEINTREKGDLARQIRKEEVRIAIKEAATGKAAGLDGIPAELWKQCEKMACEDEKKGEQAFDIVELMKRVFNDIEVWGVTKETGFAEGWICPIYKKKDQRDIANYRPITILNADYKMLTRALANRVAKVAEKLIHPDQAGFIPGRKIQDHIKLTKMMIDYAEAEEENGMIVALDQEKAYDKINHEYLWRVLEKMNFPRNIIRTIKSLYEAAESVVMVNGVMSEKFCIVRGVRQGDPMSCLLFDLAIEPLACAIRKSELQGYTIPGTGERLIATLFADDTTVYLSEHDDYGDLTRILKTWCKAARAKFNEDKTEYVPLGSREYREHLIEGSSNCKLARTLPGDATLTKEGQAIRSLGAWIGNRVDDDAPWLKMIGTIEKRLEKWNMRHPTMQGRKLAAGMEIASRTQFLTMAQTMPESIRKKIERIGADFVWKGDKHPRVGRSTLYKRPSEGGIGLIDIESRNEAIDLMWLKGYLNFGPRRPKWAYVADSLLAKAILAENKRVDKDARLNSFLQKWDVSLRRERGLPNDLRRMVKAGRKYGVIVDAVNPSEEIKAKLPVWYHIGRGEGRSKDNTMAARCLRQNHGVDTVEETLRVADRTTRRRSEHRMGRDCKCRECEEDRRVRGCDNPSRCAEAARKMLAALNPLWKPELERISDGWSLTKRRKDRNRVERERNGRITFDPTVQEKEEIEECIRVFVEEESRHEPARRQRRPFSAQDREIEVYTDGSAVKCGSCEERAGAGVYFGEGDNRNVGAKVPGGQQTNQVAEVYAVMVATDAVPPFTNLHIVTDSKYVMDGLTKNLKAWEDNGWAHVSNASTLKEAVARLRARSATTTFRWVKGHSDTLGNERADELASIGAGEQGREVQLKTPEMKFLKKGMKLSALTQRLAYRGIRRTRQSEQRKATKENLAKVKTALEAELKMKPHDREIWIAIRSKLIARKVKDFLWKTMHDAMRVGKYWKNIPGYEDRANCAECGVTDSMEHILTECKATGQKAIWSKVTSALREKGLETGTLTYGMILGAAGITTQHLLGERKAALDRLCRILIPEAAFMIWKLRCERVIQNENRKEMWPSLQEVKKRWQNTVNKRMQMDWIDSDKKYRKKPLNRDMVRKTWRGVAQPDPQGAGVLVGRPALCTGVG